VVDVEGSLIFLRGPSRREGASLKGRRAEAAFKACKRF